MRHGDPQNPKVQYSFKIFLKGELNIDGLILGFPVLDKEPFEFEFEFVNMDTCWYFKLLGVRMPRAEAYERVRYKEATSRWRQEPQIGYSGPPHSIRTMRETGHREISVAQRLLWICCVYEDSGGPSRAGLRRYGRDRCPRNHTFRQESTACSARHV